MQKISRTFKFPTFAAAIHFVDAVARLAEQEQHHPDVHIYYDEVVIESWTHDKSAVTEKDHRLMKELETLFTGCMLSNNTKIWYDK